MSSEPDGLIGAAGPGPRRGLMFIVSSPSGAGKTTLTRRLLAAETPQCILSISATTRPPRPGESHGQHYLFLSRKAFEAQREAGAFLEWAEVFGNLYGTPKAAVEDTLSRGTDILFDIDWQGARQLAASAPEDVVRVFILPPSRRVLEERLHKRASDSAEVVANRLAGASREIAHWSEYDYVIVNDDLDLSHAALRSILASERLKRTRRPGLHAIVADLLEGSS
jgi:guanylate kinase